MPVATDTATRSRIGGEVAGLIESLGRGAKRELREAIEAPALLARDPRLRIPALDLVGSRLRVRSRRPFQKLSAPIPVAAITPTPVTTTRLFLTSLSDITPILPDRGPTSKGRAGPGAFAWLRSSRPGRWPCAAGSRRPRDGGGSGTARPPVRRPRPTPLPRRLRAFRPGVRATLPVCSSIGVRTPCGQRHETLIPLSP